MAGPDVGDTGATTCRSFEDVWREVVVGEKRRWIWSTRGTMVSFAPRCCAHPLSKSVFLYLQGVCEIARWWRRLRRWLSHHTCGSGTDGDKCALRPVAERERRRFDGAVLSSAFTSVMSSGEMSIVRAVAAANFVELNCALVMPASTTDASIGVRISGPSSPPPFLAHALSTGIEVCTNLEDLSDRAPERPTRHDSPYTVRDQRGIPDGWW